MKYEDLTKNTTFIRDSEENIISFGLCDDGRIAVKTYTWESSSYFDRKGFDFAGYLTGLRSMRPDIPEIIPTPLGTYVWDSEDRAYRHARNAVMKPENKEQLKEWLKLGLWCRIMIKNQHMLELNIGCEKYHNEHGCLYAKYLFTEQGDDVTVGPLEEGICDNTVVSIDCIDFEKKGEQ